MTTFGLIILNKKELYAQTLFNNPNREELTMKIIVFEEEAYYNMLDKFSKMVTTAVKDNKEESEWVGTVEAKEILGFKSKSKMQQLRKDGEIVFSKQGRIIKYNRKGLYKFLERNASK